MSGSEQKTAPQAETAVRRYFKKDHQEALLFLELFDYTREQVPQLICRYNADIIGAAVPGEYLRFYISRKHGGYRIKFRHMEEPISFSFPDRETLEAYCDESIRYFQKNRGKLQLKRQASQPKPAPRSMDMVDAFQSWQLLKPEAELTGVLNFFPTKPELAGAFKQLLDTVRDAGFKVQVWHSKQALKITDGDRDLLLVYLYGARYQLYLEKEAGPQEFLASQADGISLKLLQLLRTQELKKTSVTLKDLQVMRLHLIPCIRVSEDVSPDQCIRDFFGAYEEGREHFERVKNERLADSPDLRVTSEGDCLFLRNGNEALVKVRRQGRRFIWYLVGSPEPYLSRLAEKAERSRSGTPRDAGLSGREVCQKFSGIFREAIERDETLSLAETKVLKERLCQLQAVSQKETGQRLKMSGSEVVSHENSGCDKLCRRLFESGEQSFEDLRQEMARVLLQTEDDRYEAVVTQLMTRFHKLRWKIEDFAGLN